MRKSFAIASICIVWVSWFAALTATPFFLANPYDGPVLTGFYAWVALGLLVGCLVGAALFIYSTHAFQDKLRRLFVECAWSRRVATAIFILGAIVAVALSAVELICFPILVEHDAEYIYSLFPLHEDMIFQERHCAFPLSVIFDTQWRIVIEEQGKGLLFVSAVLCAIAPFWLRMRFGGDVFERVPLNAQNENLSPFLFWTACIAGFLKEPLEFFIYHFGGIVQTGFIFIEEVPKWFSMYETPEIGWYSSYLAPASLIPWIFAIAIGLILCFCGRKDCEHGDGSSSAGRRRIALFENWNAVFKVVSIYVAGTIGWNFLSRSTLIYDVVPAIGWSILALLECIAVVGLVCSYVLTIKKSPLQLLKHGASNKESERRDSSSSENDSEGAFAHIEQDASCETSFSQNGISKEILASLFGEEKIGALTDREFQAFSLMLEGETSTQSSKVMGISASTVRAYLQRTYRKLGLKNGEEAAALYRGFKSDHNHVAASPNLVREDATRLSSTFSNAGWKAIVLNSTFIVGLSVVALSLVPVGVWRMPITDGRPLIFGIGLGFMLFGLAEYFKKARSKQENLVFVLPAIISWAVFAWCRLDMTLSSNEATFAIFFIASAASAYFLGVICKTVNSIYVASIHAGRGETYRLGYSSEAAIWIAIAAVFIGFILQMAWTDLNRPISASLLLASWILLFSFAAIGYTVRHNKILIMVLIAFALILSMIGRGAQVLPALSFAYLIGLLVSTHASFSRIGAVFASIGVGAALGRIGTNFCNDLIDFYSWILDFAQPGSTLSFMIGFAVAVAMLIFVAYAQFRLCVSVKSEYAIWKNSITFEREAKERAEAYLKAKGFSDSEISVGIGILQGRSSKQIADSRYLSIGTINNARFALYKGLGVKSSKEFSDKINEAIKLSNS